MAWEFPPSFSTGEEEAGRRRERWRRASSWRSLRLSPWTGSAALWSRTSRFSSRCAWTSLPGFPATEFNSGLWSRSSRSSPWTGSTSVLRSTSRRGSEWRRSPPLTRLSDVFPHIFLRARAVLTWKSGHFQRAPCTWQSLAPVFMRQSLEAFGRVPHILHVKEVLALFAHGNLDTSSMSSSCGGRAAARNASLLQNASFFGLLPSRTLSPSGADGWESYPGVRPLLSGVIPIKSCCCVDKHMAPRNMSQQQQLYSNLGSLRFGRRGASTPLWRLESCSLTK